MAASTITRATFFLLAIMPFLLQPGTALQVTPNSPCSAVCIDASDLDVSDPNSSTTRGRDIVCDDGQFDASPASRGGRFRSCLSCLQTSTYTQGKESDQAWFLYNLRYAFDYCVLGYPNATGEGVGSNPCATSEACGRLGTALKDGITDPANVQRLQYCQVDGGVVTGAYYESCLQCVQADGKRKYLSNFFIALQAACQQAPPVTLTIGLNETIFTQHVVQITKPSPPPSSSPSSSVRLSVPSIIGIAVGAVAVIALLSSCLFMQCRKRRNRKNQSRRTLSFHCQTSAQTHRPHHPQQPRYHDEDYDYDYDDERFFTETKADVHPSAAMASMSPVARSQPFLWNTPAAQEGTGTGTGTGTGIRPAVTQKQLNISTTLPAPEPAYTSPRAAGFSPDDYTPPTSTVSTRSNAPLLLGNRRPSIASTTYSTSPAVGAGISTFGGASPALSQMQFQNDGRPVRQEAQLPLRSPVGRDLAGRRARAAAPLSSPVHRMKIQTSFPPPPTK
ncbi:hypothetical protein QQS21_007366 [Conoideocrella luteorostrata]|uniref:LPXTG-domain-containing protein n=1 Tax=Conoideocrella luteorostrata TaxID=1105319 RepID=A0AAJ0CN97_9HYPO|nr:hypothetical protein QQS21_007366 [Conoideocrella luteorostrata]